METNPQTDPTQWAIPGLARRLTSIFYDSILVLAVMFIAVALVVLALDITVGWENVDADKLRRNPLYLAYLFCTMAGFHILFWTRGGQTLGMRSWRLKVVRFDGSPLRVQDAVIRYLGSMLSFTVLGLGFLWIILDRNNMAWHDHLSKTRLVLVKKRELKTS